MKQIQKSLTVALIQHACNSEKSANLEFIRQQVAQTSKRGAQLVLLQELHNGPYFCQTEETRFFDLAEPVPGPSCDALGKIAKEFKIVLVGSLFEQRAPGLCHNTAVVFESNGQLVGKYRKMHIPDDPGYYEKFYFTPGDIGFEPINTSVGKLGILVCWDQWFPEAARLMTLAGAQLLLYPTAIGWDPRDNAEEKQRQRDAWVIAQRAHGVANGIPVLSCNRVGDEADPSGATEGIQFWGHSFIAGPQGELLAVASDAPENLIYTIDMNRVADVRRIWPFLRDRRIDAYDDLLKRYRDS